MKLTKILTVSCVFFMQCIIREVTDLYMNNSSMGYTYKGTTDNLCPRAENVPCQVPQIKNILDSKKSKFLKKCPTVWDYTCQLGVLQYAWQYAPAMCPRPCKTWHYKSHFAGDTKVANNVGFNTVYLINFATDIVLKDEERKVGTYLAFSK